MRSFVHICAKCGLFLPSFIATAKEPIADNNVFSIRLKQAPLSRQCNNWRRNKMLI